MVERGGTQRYTFTAKPAGTRWYHSHDVAGNGSDAKSIRRTVRIPDRRAGQRPRGVTTRKCCSPPTTGKARWVSMQDIRKGPPPDNGLEVMYASASFNDKMLGHGEPDPRARRPARAVSAAQCEPDAEHHAGARRAIASR